MKHNRRTRSIAVGLSIAFGLLAAGLSATAHATNTWPPAACPTDAAYPRWNADPDTCTTVQKQQPSITLSRAVQATFATFRVNVTHYPLRDELLQPVTVQLSAVVLDGNGNVLTGQSAEITRGTFVSSVGAGVSGSCVVTTSSSTATCTISQLNGAVPGDSATFDIEVKAPTAGAQLRLVASTSFKEPDEGPSVIEYEPPRSDVIALLAPNPNLAASYVPLGGSLATIPTSCTGQIPGVIGCAATPTDPWTTTILVIQGANYAQIDQFKDTPGCPRAGNLLDCRESKISVPDYASGLVIFLRRDGSTIQGGNIKHAIVYYTADPGKENPNARYPLRVPACTDTTYGVLPQPGIPCLNYEVAPGRPFVTTEYKKKTTPKDGPPTPNQVVPPGFELDWEFVIYAKDNGRYIQ